MPAEDASQPPSSTSPTSSSECSSSPSAPLLAVIALSAAAAYLLHTLHRPRGPRPDPAAPALIRAWLAVDPDPETRELASELLTSYLRNPASEDLHARILAFDRSNRLRFGTAGIRAKQGPGYDRINCLVVIALSQALVKVARRYGDGVKRVVIGYDARKNSRKLAAVIARVFKHAGWEVYLFGKFVPTPFVSFAVPFLNSTWGICVTASHNPPQDNGVKVFGNDGIQIRPDVAAQIEHMIPECSRPHAVYSVEERTREEMRDPYSEVSDAYYSRMKSLCRRFENNTSTKPVVYTACHGIGYTYVCEMFRKFALPAPVPCKEQMEPDPTFPTLPFPNPEETGALDLAVATAKDAGLKVILANDPDADRLGVAEVLENGDVRVFSGDEIAMLFADYLSQGVEKERLKNYVVIASTVSSKILQAMAKVRGFQFRESLTGFKWLNKMAVDVMKDDLQVLLVYEEAIGYNITGNIVRDKDGVSGAALFAELSGTIYANGSTLSRRLSMLYEECGTHIAYNGYLRLGENSPSVKTIFDEVRRNGFPKEFGNAVVVSVRDLTTGMDTGELNRIAKLPSDSKSQFLTFRCSLDAEENEVNLYIHLRGSGTGKFSYLARIIHGGRLSCFKGYLRY